MTALEMLAAARSIIAECEKRSVNSAHRATKLENDMSWCAINIKADVGRALDEIEEMVALEEELAEINASNYRRSEAYEHRKFNEDGEDR